MRKRTRDSDDDYEESSSEYDSEEEVVRKTPRKRQCTSKYENIGKLFYPIVQQHLTNYYSGPSILTKKDITKIITNEEPTLEEILNSHLLIEEKKRLVELFEIYEKEDTDDFVKLRIRQKILLSLGRKSLITKYNTFQDDELALMRERQVNKFPSLASIIKAFLTKEEKIKCLDMYDMLHDEEVDQQTKILCAKKIHSIIATQLSSQNEVDLIEAQERSLPHVNIPNTKKSILSLYTTPKNKRVLLNLCSDVDDNSARMNWYLKLPYQKISLSNTNLDDIYSKLNANIHGMREAKEEVMRFIHDKQKGVGTTSIIALEGSPGVGKTCFASNIAAAINVPFFKINLGGMTDATIFKGSEKVWKGSSPSFILQYLCQAGVSDILILLDEIDKIGNSSKGMEVYQSLLHILDPSQNREFQDLYLSDIPHDLSRIWFVLSMNDSSVLDATLKDRMKIIKLKDYSSQEKKEIVWKHSLPSIYKDKGVTPQQISVDASAIDVCLKMCEGEGGMRSVERILHEVISKISLYESASEQLRKELTFKPPNFVKYPYIITDYVVREVHSGNIKKGVLSYYS